MQNSRKNYLLLARVAGALRGEGGERAREREKAERSVGGGASIFLSYDFLPPSLPPPFMRQLRRLTFC